MYNLENEVQIAPDKVTLFKIDKKDIICDLLSYCVKVYFKNNSVNKADINDICEFAKQFIKDNFVSYDYISDVLGKSIKDYFETDFICDHKKKYLNKPIYSTKNTS